MKPNTTTTIEKVRDVMKTIRIVEGMGSLVEDWWLRTAQNIFEYVNLYKVRSSSYDEFVLETTIGIISIPIEIPCMGCSILHLYDNPKYSDIHRVLLDEDETVEDYLYRGLSK